MKLIFLLNLITPLSQSEAIKMGLTFVRVVGNDERGVLKCDSIWSDEFGRKYRVIDNKKDEKAQSSVKICCQCGKAIF